MCVAGLRNKQSRIFGRLLISIDLYNKLLINAPVKLVTIYKCLCDETRLRILNLLSVSPLCVCHLQFLIGKSQVVISQHLAYLRERGMVTGRRHQQWVIYSLPGSPSRELEMNLKCLQDCALTEPIFRSDQAKLRDLIGQKTVQELLEEGCCTPSFSPILTKS